MDGVKTVILGAGMAGGFYPLSLALPKPLATIGTVSLLEIIINLLIHAEIDNATLVLRCVGGVPPHVKAKVHSQNFQLHTHAISPKSIGSIPAVIEAIEGGDEPVIMIIYGDSLIKADLGKFLSFHHNAITHGALASLLVHQPLDLVDNGINGRTYHGVTWVDNNNIIKKFIEKPLISEIYGTNWAHTGLFICQRELLNNLKYSNGKTDFSKDVFEPLVMQAPHGQVHACKIDSDGFRLDIGNPERFFKANMDCAQGILKFQGLPPLLPGRSDIRSETSFDASLRIDSNVIIGSEVEIHPSSVIGPNAVIGNGCRIKESSYIQNSVLMDFCQIGSNCQINQSIIGNHTIVFDNILIPQGSIIGPYSKIGSQCLTV